MLSIKNAIILASYLIVTPLFAQEELKEWRPNNNFTITDFKSNATQVSKEVKSLYLQTGVNIELAFQMSNLAFMFTKNFNSKVSCVQDSKSAVLMAQNEEHAQQLLNLANFDFDLSELYARKIRKALYENKKTFSKGDFFMPYYNKIISERNQLSSRVYSETEFGKNKELLLEEHQKIKEELNNLAAFCKNCKPPKK